MRVRFLLSVLTCLSLVFVVGTPVAIPAKQPLQDKDAEAKKLLAEHKALRDRLEQVERRLSELKSLPVWVHVSRPYGGGVNSRVLPRDKKVFMNVVLSTNQNTWVGVSARQVLKDKFFRFEVEIPHQDVKQPPIRVIASARVEDSSEIEASFLVPKAAKLGRVAIKVSWAESGRIVQGTITHRLLYIAPAK